jgi:hypothetical protein
MPIFGRRKLQLMLDELAQHLTASKSTDLLKRLEHKEADQAIPAEYELALTWGVSKVAHLQIERPFGNRAPDIYSEDLLRSAPVAVDVAAISDDSLGDESVMRRAANIIAIGGMIALFIAAKPELFVALVQ